MRVTWRAPARLRWIPHHPGVQQCSTSLQGVCEDVPGGKARRGVHIGSEEAPRRPGTGLLHISAPPRRRPSRTWRWRIRAAVDWAGRSIGSTAPWLGAWSIRHGSLRMALSLQQEQDGPLQLPSRHPRAIAASGGVFLVQEDHEVPGSAHGSTLRVRGRLSPDRAPLGSRARPPGGPREVTASSGVGARNQISWVAVWPAEV